MARKTYDKVSDRITFEDKMDICGSWCECRRSIDVVLMEAYRGPYLTPRQARDVARWLNETADQIERDIKAGKA
jgi:hypothetical protein